MCGRILLLDDDELFAVVDALNNNAQLELAIDERASDTRAQARPTSHVFAVIKHETGFFAEKRRWGYRPSWSKHPLFNTRIEQAQNESAMWSASFADGRCLLPVAGFFEPDEHKRPYLFTASSHCALLLACISDGQSLSVVTCEPCADVAPIHHRMPLVVLPDELPLWFSDAYPSLAKRQGLYLNVEPEARAQQTLF